MKALSCEAAEALLLERRPLDDDLAAHLERCPSCGELHAALEELSAELASAELAPAPALVERTFAAAAAESRALSRERRRAVRRAGAKAALVFVATLPLLAGFHAGVAILGRRLLPELLPAGALLYVEVVWGLFVLAALSALAFTLTLIAGAAARPPRPEGILEVRHG